MDKDIDFESRKKLTEVLNKNFIVEAGAGSGKTTALVKRLVAMVESGVDVSTISCITFTKAAANEFYERFQTLLSKRSKITPENLKPAKRPGDLGPVDADTVERCREALNNIDLCFMGTIDSFVQKLMNEHPYEFNVPAKTAVISEDDVVRYITEEYLAILNDDSYYSSEVCELTRKASTYVSKDVFLDGIQLFMRLKANKLKYPVPQQLDFDLDKEFAKEKAQIVNILNVVVDFLENANDVKLTEKQKKLLNQKRTIIYSWNKNTKVLTGALDLLKSCIIKAKDLAANDMELPDGMFTLEKGSYKLDKEFFDDVERRIELFVNPLVYYACHKCAQAISKKFQHFGYFTYADFIVSLRDSLKKDAKEGGKIIKYIQQTRKYYMLDEFQDTNPLQVEIFFYLSASEPNENYRECKPMPGSLFIVGDPKQSIYRFTGADVQVFGDTKELLDKDENGEVLYLTRNFRSSKNLKDWFNDTMKPTLTTKADNTEFLDIPTDNIPEGDDKATFHNVYRFKDVVNKVGRKSVYNFDQVSNLVNTIVNNPKYTILAKDDNDQLVIRKIKYKDIMLIAAKKRDLSSYMRSFAEHKIPYFTEGAVAFEESEALVEIKALFSALVLPENKDLIYHALLTKFVGMNESEIKAVFASGNDIQFGSENIESIPEEIRKKYAKLSDLYAKTLDFSYSAKMLYLIENTNVYERCSGEYMEYVYYSYELVKKACEEGTIVTAKDAVEFIQNISSDNSEYERCFSLSNDAGQGRVHLANLHKTKGLEAPVVILLYSKKGRPKTKEFRTERDASGATSYIFGVSHKIGDNTSFELKHDEFGKQYKKDEPSTLWVEAEDLSEEAERRRLEYVAATRARCALLISDPVYIDESGAQVAGDESYWNDMLVNTSKKIKIETVDINQSAVSSLDSSKEEKAKDLYDNAPTLVEDSFKRSYQLTRPSKLIIKKAVDDFDDFDDLTLNGFDQESNAREDAATRGTLAHRLMELLVNAKGHYAKADLINNIKNEYQVNYENEKMLNKLYDSITNGGFDQQNGSVPNDILNVLKNAKNVMCEVPFSYMDGYKLYHGVIDVLYEDEKGWHIVDYKTNKEVDIEHLEDEYKGQLQGYIDSLEKTTGIKAVDACIYHLDC